MKIEIDTDKYEIPVLIKPKLKSYSQSWGKGETVVYPTWELVDICINFDKNKTETHNKKEAEKVADLLYDILELDIELFNDNQKLFNLIREALRKRFGLVEKIVV